VKLSVGTEKKTAHVIVVTLVASKLATMAHIVVRMEFNFVRWSDFVIIG
jgi:hypothetical protein